MEPLVVGILIAAIATIAGALVGAMAGLGAAAIAGRHQRDLAREEADRRLVAERQDRIRSARLDEVARTRRRLIHQIGMLRAAAVGKRYTALPAEPDEATNIGLLGSTELILDYRALLIDLQAKLGAGISAEDQARSTNMEVRVIMH